MMPRKRAEFGLLVVAVTAVMAVPAFAVVQPIVDIYGSYTYGLSGVTPGDNAPTIDLTGGLKNTKYFNVDNLVEGGNAGYAVNDPNGLLFTVDPTRCITGSGTGCQYKSGTENATISVDFTFYDSHGTEIGTAYDTALATFDYFSNPSRDDDNLCWNNGSVGGTAVVSHKLVGTCGLPGTGLQTAYEQIEVDLNGADYDVNLYDWNDWNEQPKISFQSIKPPVETPEPSSLTLVVGGLFAVAGFAAVRRKRLAAAVA